jgi:hypothetical protein
MLISILKFILEEILGASMGKGGAMSEIEIEFKDKVLDVIHKMEKAHDCDSPWIIVSAHITEAIAINASLLKIAADRPSGDNFLTGITTLMSGLACVGQLLVKEMKHLDDIMCEKEER